jgi:4-carboxymuconolactone decarboxylase
MSEIAVRFRPLLASGALTDGGQRTSAETLRMPGVSQQITGPQRLVLRNLKLNHAFQTLISALRTETTVTELDHELAILATVREKRSAYTWEVHVIRGLEAGVSDAAIDVIRSRAAADRLPAADADIVTYARQLARLGQAKQDVFDRLLSAHDDRWLMELTLLISWYCGIARFANASEIEPADGADRLPPK